MAGFFGFVSVKGSSRTLKQSTHDERPFGMHPDRSAALKKAQKKCISV